MTIVAEIGTAHGGNVQKAFDLIDEAHEAGADAVKFQWVYADEILHPDTGFVTLPGGKVRLYDRFRELEVAPSFFATCLEYAHKRNMRFICSPFGIRSLRELMEIHPDGIKIASPEVNHFPLLHETAKFMQNEFDKKGTITPVILSSGVSKLGDLEKAIQILNVTSQATAPYLTLLHCITCYPAPENEYNVRCVQTLHDIFGIETGISDHSLDPVLVPVLTTAIGGTMIEKHITLSKKTDGLDDPVALEADQFAHMVYCVHQAEAVIERFKKDAYASQKNSCMTGAPSKSILLSARDEIVRQLSDEFGAEKVNAVIGNGVKHLAPSELANYGRTNRSLHFMHNMSCGEVIGKDDVAVLRTEKILTPGMSPEFLDTVIGSRLQCDVTSGEGVTWRHVVNYTK